MALFTNTCQQSKECCTITTANYFHSVDTCIVTTSNFIGLLSINCNNSICHYRLAHFLLRMVGGCVSVLLIVVMLLHHHLGI